MKTYPTKALIILRTTFFAVVFLFIFCLGFSFINISNDVQAATYHWCCYSGCTTGECSADTGALCINSSTYNEHECCTWTTAVCDSGLCLNGACYNGIIYPINSSINTSDSSSDKEVAGNMGGTTPVKWYDQDFNGDLTGLEAYAGDFCQSPNVWFNIRNSCKSAGPGNICSDYNSENGFCCGDDANEKSVPNCAGVANSACCPTTASYVDFSGNCVASCPALTIPSLEISNFCNTWHDRGATSGVQINITPNCNSGSSCVYKVYRNTTNNFSTASEIFSDSSTLNAGYYLWWSDNNVIANTNYYYWLVEYDNSGNFITRSSSPTSFYAPRIGSMVSGVSSYSAAISNDDQYDVAILWQWDEYPGSNGYYFKGTDGFESFNFTKDYLSAPYVSDEMMGFDHYIYSIPATNNSSVLLNYINSYKSNAAFKKVANEIDYSKPFVLLFREYISLYEIHQGFTLMIRPTFSSQGTLLCGEAGKERVIPPLVETTPPGTPQNLHHTSNTENSITWEWEPGDGGSVDHYIVYNSSGALLDSTVADATYTWNDLEFPNTQYGIKVVAVNSYGVSDATAISYAYTSIEQPTSLSCTPTKTSLAVTANGTISDPSPTNQYLTKIAFAKDGTYSTWQESASINYSGLTCGTSYNIWAKTRNGDGEERDRVSTTCSTQSCTSGPDLIIDNISFSNSVCRGDTVSASITTKNIGDATTGQTSKTKVFIDSDDTGAGGIANLLDTWANILTANSSQIITTDSWDTTGVSLGEHTLVAIADAPTDSRISESNENNNVLRKSFTVVDCGGGGSSSFYLLTPDNNATGVSVSPTLDWEESIGASSYYIYMCEGVDCTLSLLDSTSNDEYVINTPFNYNTIYKWDVVAWNGTETTDSYNGPFSFTTMAEGVIGTPPTAHYDWCKINDNTIQFLDRSVPGDSPINAWEYDFNDGDKCNPDCTESGYDGTNRNPVHTFTDVDPIYSSPDFGWYSTLENNDSILNQEAGSGATVIGTPTYESAVNGSGMIIDQNNEGVKIPINSTNFDYISGAIQLAYKPDYASNSGEPNHYIFRADGPTGDSFELKYQNNGLYYKIYDADADTQCVISAINIIPGWSADQWLKLVATWNQSTSPKMSLKVYDQNSGNLLNSWTNTTCTMNFSTAITLTDMYVGTWVGGTYNALGTVDDFMMFLNDTYTATLSGGLDVSLKATAENGGTNTYTETLDLTNGPPCGYNLSSVAAINCHTIDLIWQPHSMTVDGYDIYRSTSASGPWVLVKDGATGTTYSNYDADNINENTRYYYYISTSPMSINNSTDSPACTGGVGAGTKCPLSAVTPICPIDDFRISTIRKCGSITFRFATIENAKSYEIQKSVADNLHYTNVLTIAEDQIATYCNDNYCSYTDTEVLPVNIINPASKFKYWYQARAQGQDDTWTNWSTEISDYSYCYRSKDWQEK